MSFVQRVQEGRKSQDDTWFSSRGSTPDTQSIKVVFETTSHVEGDHIQPQRGTESPTNVPTRTSGFNMVVSSSPGDKLRLGRGVIVAC